MELAEPSIGTAVAKCASAGCKTAVIAPYFLSRGRHITSDIPALVAEAQLANPGVRCIIAEPIGAPACMHDPAYPGVRCIVAEPMNVHACMHDSPYPGVHCIIAEPIGVHACMHGLAAQWVL